MLQTFLIILALRYIFLVFLGEAELGIHILKVKLIIAETKGITKSKLAISLPEAIVPKEVLVKITVFGTADGKLALDEKASCSNKM